MVAAAGERDDSQRRQPECERTEAIPADAAADARAALLRRPSMGIGHDRDLDQDSLRFLGDGISASGKVPLPHPASIALADESSTG
jgi:hypothetical protein